LRAFFAASQAALEALEGHDFASAARQAGALLASHPGDGALLLILARAADALVKADASFDPVWTPPGKGPAAQARPLPYSAAGADHPSAEIADHVEVDALRHLFQDPVDVLQRPLAITVLVACHPPHSALPS